MTVSLRSIHANADDSREAVWLYLPYIRVPDRADALAGWNGE